MRYNDYSGDEKRKANPTHYRKPSIYNALLSSASRPCPDGEGVEGYGMLEVKSIQTYIKVGYAIIQKLYSVDSIQEHAFL